MRVKVYGTMDVVWEERGSRFWFDCAILGSRTDCAPGWDVALSLWKVGDRMLPLSIAWDGLEFL